jgi:membrane protease YdiL (CAAX protease family)
MNTGEKSFVQKFSFWLFLLLTFILSWLPWFTGGEGIWVFGPSIAGIIVIILVAGKDGLRDLTQRLFRWRVGVKWWLVAIFLPAALTLVAVGVSLLLGGSIPPFTFFRQEWYYVIFFFLINMLGGPLGEEFGWRGFALPRLQEKFNPLVSSLILGGIWGLWHIPQFFNPNAFHSVLGLGMLPVYVLAQMGLVTIMTWVYNSTKGSLLLGGLIYHTADNFWSTVLLTDATFTAAMQGVASGTVERQVWLISVIANIAFAVILAIVTKGRLGLKKD